MTHEEDNETKVKIFSTAATLFSQNGFNGVSMREISEHSGVSKPTIYYYFGSKKGIYETLVKTGVEHVFETLEKVNNLDLSAKDKLKEMTRRFFYISWKNPEFVKFFMSLGFWQENNECSEEMKKVALTRGHVLMDIINEGKKTGQFGKNVEADVAMNIIGGTIQLYTVQQLKTDKKILTDQLADKVIERIFIGLNE